MPAWSDDDDDDAVPQPPPPAPPTTSKQLSVGAMFGRKHKKPNKNLSFDSASAADAAAAEPVVDDAFASAMETSNRNEFVPPSTHVSPNDNDANDENSDSDPDFSDKLATSSSATTATIKSRVNQTEALASVAQAADEEAHEFLGVVDVKKRKEGKKRNSETTATTEDFVDNMVKSCKFMMRGPKKSKNRSNIGVDFSDHVLKADLAYVHAMLAVPKNFPDTDGLDFETSDSGVQCFSPFELDNPTLFFEAGVDAEGKMMNDLVDESDLAAVRMATSCIVMSRDTQEANNIKRVFCMFLRVKLSDEPVDCSPQLLEQWNTFKTRAPPNTEVLMSIQRETAHKLCKHPVAKAYICDSVAKCFSTSRVAKKKEAIVFDYRRLDDDTRADVVVSVSPEKAERKRSSAASDGASTSTAPKKQKIGVGKAPTWLDTSSREDTVEESQTAQTAQTALVVHPERGTSSGSSIWSGLVDQASVVEAPFPNAPEFVHLPIDPSKVTLVPCGKTGVILQFTM